MKSNTSSKGFTLLELIVVFLVLLSLISIFLVMTRSCKETASRAKAESLRNQSYKFVLESGKETVTLLESKTDSGWKLTATLAVTEPPTTVIGTDPSWDKAPKADGVPIPDFRAWSFTIKQGDDVLLIGTKKIEPGPHGIAREIEMTVERFGENGDPIETELPADAESRMRDMQDKLMHAVRAAYRQEHLVPNEPVELVEQ